VHALLDLFKHWFAKQIQQMVVIGVPTSTMRVDNCMEIIHENPIKLFMAWDKLCIHKEMIASNWG
jgi:hypothetical protein